LEFELRKNGLAANEDHGLGPEFGFLPQARPLAAAEDDDIHGGILAFVGAKHFFIAPGCTALALLFLAFFGVRNYGGNISALLHMDARFGEQHSVPEGLVLYKDAGYDGMLYYQVARDIPALLSGEKPSLDSPYRFQRILLPLFSYVLALGDARALPFTLLFANIAAAVGAIALMSSITRTLNLHTLAVVANPAVLVGILFSLTEPLSLFFVVLFFWFWERNDQKLNVFSIGALSLSLFARETTVVLIGLLILWFLWRKQWQEMLIISIPLIIFALWQIFLVIHLGSLAFQADGNIVGVPLSGPLALIEWSFQNLNVHRLSALSLLLFLLLLCLSLALEWRRKRCSIGVYSFLLSGLILAMFSMDAHIWGVITSIGRVVAPVYPVYALYASAQDTWKEQFLSIVLISISVVTALGIANIQHPFTISS
jgi:hypothetical protein